MIAWSLDTTLDWKQALSRCARGPESLDVDLPTVTDQFGYERMSVRLGMVIADKI